MLKKKISSGAFPGKRKSMPSVGMRRSTRVFGARVLRSGRRLWTKPQEDSNKVRVYHGDDQWAELLEDSADVVEGADDVCKEAKQENKNSEGDMEMEEIPPEYGDVEVKTADRMYGIMYRRKRKRAEFDPNEDRRYGKKFFRKQWRKRSKVAVSETRGVDQSSVIGLRELAITVNGPAWRYSFWITCFLATVLSYMLGVRIGVRRFSAFLLYKPIFDAYTSSGVLFLQELYKECYERNLLSHVASVIHVPTVQEVLDTNKDYKPYARPASYIRVRDDE
ncbi:Unknown protein [Striga hermonthica]|uniref:Transmembrane protein n=1 Tax=Striga hermonthica TaxID=68872 RepID=A0A9N7MXW2_STRHE|nr:Unknown protein [Striga hermonthica]